MESSEYLIPANQISEKIRVNVRYVLHGKRSGKYLTYFPTADLKTMHEYILADVINSSGALWPSLAWPIGIFCLSYIYRKNRGKPIFSKVHDPSFITYFASGGGCHGLFWMRRCLIIAVTDSRLMIQPWFPFNMFFLPELLYVEHEIPFEDIVRVCKSAEVPWGASVKISWRNCESRIITGKYKLSEIDLFLNKLQQKGVPIEKADMRSVKN